MVGSPERQWWVFHPHRENNYWRQKLKNSILLLSAMLLSVLLIHVGCRANDSITYTAMYLDVNAQDMLSALKTGIVKDYSNLNIPKYIESSGKLHLIFQVTWTEGFTVEVRKEKWDAIKIHALMSQANYNLREYFPNPYGPFGLGKYSRKL